MKNSSKSRRGDVDKTRFPFSVAIGNLYRGEPRFFLRIGKGEGGEVTMSRSVGGEAMSCDVIAL